MSKRLTLFSGEHVVESDLPSDYMERIAEYVDSKFRKLSDPGRSEIEIAAFTALNIADELFQERESGMRSRETAKRAIEVVEKALSDSISSLGCS
jgi:cell division protein ZapA (FtsZ GTPase activity inhibitor)